MARFMVLLNLELRNALCATFDVQRLRNFGTSNVAHMAMALILLFKVLKK